MKVYLSGHMRKLEDKMPGTYWRDIFKMFFDKYATNHYKAKKVYPLPPLTFLEPLERTSLEINAARDKMLMNSCDVAVVYLNLKIGRCLGAMFEMGYLVAHGKPIVLINDSRDIVATKFIEHNSDVVVYDLDEAAKALYFIVKDKTKEEE